MSLEAQKIFELFDKEGLTTAIFELIYKYMKEEVETGKELQIFISLMSTSSNYIKYKELDFFFKNPKQRNAVFPQKICELKDWFKINNFKPASNRRKSKEERTLAKWISGYLSINSIHDKWKIEMVKKIIDGRQSPAQTQIDKDWEENTEKFNEYIKEKGYLPTNYNHIDNEYTRLGTFVQQYLQKDAQQLPEKIAKIKEITKGYTFLGKIENDLILERNLVALEEFIIKNGRTPSLSFEDEKYLSYWISTQLENKGSLEQILVKELIENVSRWKEHKSIIRYAEFKEEYKRYVLKYKKFPKTNPKNIKSLSHKLAIWQKHIFYPSIGTALDEQKTEVSKLMEDLKIKIETKIKKI